ncbi:hypothetical protein [Streptomyces sp. CB01635]|uniref:hypothetical protein n=1 Tax=Streptomyces sp. CB01635 TaxID=2020326 RepID=UPI00131B37F7|nr:hypothetical protein [Streptomyces sp. CB01635]
MANSSGSSSAYDAARPSPMRCLQPAPAEERQHVRIVNGGAPEPSTPATRSPSSTRR